MLVVFDIFTGIGIRFYHRPQTAQHGCIYVCMYTYMYIVLVCIISIGKISTYANFLSCF